MSCPNILSFVVVESGGQVIKFILIPIFVGINRRCSLSGWNNAHRTKKSLEKFSRTDARYTAIKVNYKQSIEGRLLNELHKVGHHNELVSRRQYNDIYLWNYACTCGQPL